MSGEGRVVTCCDQPYQCFSWSCIFIHSSLGRIFGATLSEHARSRRTSFNEEPRPVRHFGPPCWPQTARIQEAWWPGNHRHRARNSQGGMILRWKNPWSEDIQGLKVHTKSPLRGHGVAAVQRSTTFQLHEETNHRHTTSVPPSEGLRRSRNFSRRKKTGSGTCPLGCPLEPAPARKKTSERATHHRRMHQFAGSDGRLAKVSPPSNGPASRECSGFSLAKFAAYPNLTPSSRCNQHIRQLYGSAVFATPNETC